MHAQRGLKHLHPQMATSKPSSSSSAAGPWCGHDDTSGEDKVSSEESTCLQEGIVLFSNDSKVQLYLTKKSMLTPAVLYAYAGRP